jgi:fermentation-respiration switch protein FrsA (DUF1100 family)
VEWLAAFVGVCLAAGVGVLALGWVGSSWLLRRRRPDPAVRPEELRLPAEEVIFRSQDGTSLGGWWIRAPEAVGTVVVCSGQRGSLDGDLPTYGPMFYEVGLNVLAFDWRAHGRSGGRYVTFGAYEKEDLLGALDFLAGRGVRRVGLMGLSMGAMVSLITAALSDRVAVVVCDGLPARLQSTVANHAAQRGVPRWLAERAAHFLLVFASLRAQANMSSHVDPWRWAPHVGGTPVMLIHGDRDPLVSVDEIEEVFNLLPGPKVLWRLPSAGHRQAYAQRPEEYAQRVVNWFTRYL